MLGPRQLEEGRSQDSQASSAEGDFKTVLRSIQHKATAKVEKKQSDLRDALARESAAWEQRWVEVVARHDEERSDLVHEINVELETNAREQKLVRTQIHDCKLDIMKLLAKLSNLFAKEDKSWEEASGKTLGEISGLLHGEERCFFDGLVGLAKRDRTNTFGTALTTTDPANDLDRVPV